MNPYDPPGIREQSQAGEGFSNEEFSPDRLPYVLLPTRITVIAFLAFGFLCLAISVGAAIASFLTDLMLTVTVLISMTFLLFSAICATVPFTKLIIDGVGIRSTGIRSWHYPWKDITSWYKDMTSGLLFVVHRRGKTVMVANAAITKDRMREVAKALEYFVGEETVSNT